MKILLIVVACDQDWTDVEVTHIANAYSRDKICILVDSEATWKYYLPNATVSRCVGVRDTAWRANSWHLLQSAVHVFDAEIASTSAIECLLRSHAPVAQSRADDDKTIVFFDVDHFYAPVAPFMFAFGSIYDDMCASGYVDALNDASVYILPYFSNLGISAFDEKNTSMGSAWQDLSYPQLVFQRCDTFESVREGVRRLEKWEFPHADVPACRLCSQPLTPDRMVKAALIHCCLKVGPVQVVNRPLSLSVANDAPPVVAPEESLICASETPETEPIPRPSVHPHSPPPALDSPPLPPSSPSSESSDVIQTGVAHRRDEEKTGFRCAIL